jgi:hypothetical protein
LSNCPFAAPRYGSFAQLVSFCFMTDVQCNNKGLLPRPAIPSFFEDRCEEDPRRDEQRARFAYYAWCDLPEIYSAQVHPIQSEYAQRMRADFKQYYYRGLCTITHRLPINHSGSTQLAGPVHSGVEYDGAILDHPNLAVPVNGRFIEVEQ